MTPEECREQVGKEYERLRALAAKRRINESAVYGLVKSFAVDAARHTGDVGGWRDFMPEELMKEQAGDMLAAAQEGK